MGAAGDVGPADHPISLSCQISDAVYRMVYEQTKAQYDAVTAKCEQERPQMESTIRTDMDQIITSKEHLASKIRGTALREHAWPWMCVAVSVMGSWCGITTVSPRCGCSWGAAWLLPAWPGTLGEMPGCTSSLALSQEMGDKVGSDPPPSKAVGQEQVQYRCRAPCKNLLYCPASLGDLSWRSLGRGAGPTPSGRFRT